jgi:aryl-alcohol dehydrogenase-like predicted oxidoreductase
MTTTQEGGGASIDRRSLIGSGALLAAAGASFAADRVAAERPRTGRTRKLGSLDVSPIGLGCMSMGPGFYNPAPDPKAMVAVIRGAFDAGVTFFDTAEVYGPHVSETIVGEALQPIRDKVVIASKMGFEIDPAVVNNRDRNAQPAHIRTAVEGMLRRLRTDHIDLLYLHRIDPKVPVEDVAATVAALIKEGKVKHFGLSEVTPDTLRRAHAVQKVSAVQSEYSLLERAPEAAILDACQQLGVGFVAWGPTMRGLFSDRFNEYSRFATDDRRANVPFFKPEALPANLKVVDLARKWAEKRNATPVQFALAWLLAERPFIVPIPGTTRLHHARENMGALDIQLTAEERKAFRAELEQIAIVGARTGPAVVRDL